MALFRLFLAACFLGLSLYTGVVIAGHGWGLFSVFFGDIAQMGWPGQFDADFLCLLTLLGLWAAWREGFGLRGLVMGLLAFNLGTLFLATYLLVLARRHDGNLRVMLAGGD
jgi:hypothetical protein